MRAGFSVTPRGRVENGPAGEGLHMYPHFHPPNEVSGSSHRMKSVRMPNHVSLPYSIRIGYLRIESFIPFA